MPRLLEKYRQEALPVLMEEFGYKNPMQAPRLVKVVINMGVKEGQEDIKILDQIAIELGRITGQKPVVTRAKKSISAFKLREGSPIGLKVTLRKIRMYEFVDRLFNVAMPRIRDFRGFLDKSFDQRGNFSIGLTEQTIFPEVEYDKIKKTQGMDITFVTTAENHKEGKRLLELLGFPFRK
ncbi:MAG TPA: 50S ribosomal protein L5 [Candidatus Omnitrophota bacterium]|nr:50S ribosomal protein L5 [Candidatus Omnitrophota bacterium]HPS36178.1 50S ribosomal protein L5 [Candidatus Omnitrophota bacterium]